MIDKKKCTTLVLVSLLGFGLSWFLFATFDGGGYVFGYQKEAINNESNKVAFSGGGESDNCVWMERLAVVNHDVKPDRSMVDPPSFCDDGAGGFSQVNTFISNKPQEQFGNPLVEGLGIQASGNGFVFDACSFFTANTSQKDEASTASTFELIGADKGKVDVEGKFQMSSSVSARGNSAAQAVGFIAFKDGGQVIGERVAKLQETAIDLDPEKVADLSISHDDFELSVPIKLTTSDKASDESRPSLSGSNCLNKYTWDLFSAVKVDLQADQDIPSPLTGRARGRLNGKGEVTITLNCPCN